MTTITAAVLHEFRQFVSILCHHCLLHGLTSTKEALHEKEAVTSDSLSKNIEISYLDRLIEVIDGYCICAAYTVNVEDEKNNYLSKSLVASWRQCGRILPSCAMSILSQVKLLPFKLEGQINHAPTPMHHPLKSAQSWKVLKSCSVQRSSFPPPCTTFCSIENLKDRLSRAFRQ